MDNRIMFMPLTHKIFDLMFEIKSKHLDPITDQYHCSKQELSDILWEEFNIPGMEIRIANTAFDFLIMNCERKEELEATLKKEVKRNVLASGIFYTNIAPDAASTQEFEEAAKS